MRQTYLDSYFKSPPQKPSHPGLNFLDLPPSIRQRIYGYLGLINQSVSLNFSNLLVYPYKHYPDSTYAVRSRCRHLDREIIRVNENRLHPGEHEIWENDDEDDEQFGCWWRDLCKSCSAGYGLFFVCKAISGEVIPLLYSSSTFIAHQGGPNGLRRLQQLSPFAVSSLTSLILRLDPRHQVAWCDDDIDEQPLVPLHFNSHEMRAAINEYKETIERLAQFARPNSLNLYLIFRALTQEVLHAVLQPLFQLPVLKNCGIWSDIGTRSLNSLYGPDRLYLSTFSVSNTHTEEIEQLIHSTIRKLTQTPNLEKGFRYLDLPIELRFQILQYTDLVSDYDIQWRPQMSIPHWESVKKEGCYCFKEHGSAILEIPGDCVCQFERYRLWKHRCKPIEISENYNGYSPFCCGTCRPELSTNMCFCSQKCSIYSTACSCRHPRHALFSVSRQVRADAIATYYSHNRFFVTPFRAPYIRTTKTSVAYSPWPPDGEINMSSIELSLYISAATCNALQYIRWLEWVLPSSRARYLLPNTRAWFDYLDTLDVMREAMNISNLTFVLNMAGQGVRINGRSRPVSPLDWKWYGQIALALQRLGPLKDCFIYLSRNSHRIKERIYHEKNLEKAIMGREYDSAKRGKLEERITSLASRYY